MPDPITSVFQPQLSSALKTSHRSPPGAHARQRLSSMLTPNSVRRSRQDRYRSSSRVRFGGVGVGSEGDDEATTSDAATPSSSGVEVENDNTMSLDDAATPSSSTSSDIEVENSNTMSLGDAETPSSSSSLSGFENDNMTPELGPGPEPEPEPELEPEPEPEPEPTASATEVEDDQSSANLDFDEVSIGDDEDDDGDDMSMNNGDDDDQEIDGDVGVTAAMQEKGTLARVAYKFHVLRMHLLMAQWRSHQVAQQKAIESVIDSLDDEVDTFVEVMFGANVDAAQSLTPSDDDAAIESHMQGFSEAVQDLSFESKHLDAVKNTLLAEIDRAMYLLRKTE